MHSYMAAIGFSDITNEELEKIIYGAIKNPDSHEVAVNSENINYVEIRLEVCKNIGIAIRGEYDENDSFKMDYYFPYYESNNLSTSYDLEIIKQSDRESYQGCVDEPRLGVNLIYYLLNMMTYLQRYRGRTKFYGENYRSTYLSALSLDGKILLPLKEYNYKSATVSQTDRRSTLVAQAREGDEEAIESLTLEDIDTYSMISRRVGKEDVYSIVSTSFMPYGIESDKYSIIGVIEEISECINNISMEEMYVLKVSVNDLDMDVCINKKDLFGEPMVGRRFKGNIWLQGSIEF